MFINTEAKEKGLTDNQKEKLKKLLFNSCKANKLSKNTEVTYNREKCIIETIKILNYEEGTYTLKSTETKKQKGTTKSRSNIDRFIRNA